MAPALRLSIASILTGGCLRLLLQHDIGPPQLLKGVGFSSVGSGATYFVRLGCHVGDHVRRPSRERCETRQRLGTCYEDPLTFVH